MTEQKYNRMQTVKRRFFAMRNGIISDTLRKAGSPFHIIFGLNLPQLVEIAEETGKDPVLAAQLWANTTTRESMLLAPMLVDASAVTVAQAREWIAGIPCAEVSDILCHRLLRHISGAWELAESLSDSPVGEWNDYTALRLLFNLLGSDPQRALGLALRFPDSSLRHSIEMEAEWRMSL